MPTKSWIEVPINQEVEGVPTTGYAPYFFPIEGGTALFKFTAEEFTQVLSALINGAALTYPDMWIQVVWYFLRSVEFPVEICEQIIGCINSDVDTQQAIVNMLKGNQTFNEYLETRVRGLTEGQIGGKLILGDCDDAVVAGRVKAIVDAMDQANKDWLEKIEVGTNDEEKFALALEAIPVVGELPFDQLIEFGEDILEDFTENYNAQVDAELLEEWYCGLYCLAKENADCSLTYGEIYKYFADRTSSGLNPFSALVDVVGFIRTGDFSGGTKVADGLMMLQTGLMANGRSFMGSSLPTIAKAARDAGTASFYEDCEDCPEGDLWLVPILASGVGLELISDDGDTQTWKLTMFDTGHYLTGGGISSDGTPFYVHDVEYNPAETGPKARYVSGTWTYPLDQVPCDLPATKAAIYEGNAASEITITISRTPCVTDIWNSPTMGTKTGETTTSVSFEAVDAGGGQWFVVATTIEGWGFDVSSGDWDAYPVGMQWRNQYGDPGSGFPPSGTPIKEITFTWNEPSILILEGTRVEI